MIQIIAAADDYQQSRKSPPGHVWPVYSWWNLVVVSFGHLLSRLGEFPPLKYIEQKCRNKVFKTKIKGELPDELSLGGGDAFFFLFLGRSSLEPVKKIMS